jgi:hypothetical protein
MSGDSRSRGAVFNIKLIYLQDIHLLTLNLFSQLVVAYSSCLVGSLQFNQMIYVVLIFHYRCGPSATQAFFLADTSWENIFFFPDLNY